MTICLSPNGPMVHRGVAPRKVMVATIGGVAVLEKDSSGKWSLTDTVLQGLHVSALLHDPESGNVYASSHNKGVRKSVDGGKTWEAINEGLTKTNVFCLSAVRKDGKLVLLAGTEPVSLFKSEDEGRSWVEYPSAGEVPGHELWTFPVPPFDAHLKDIALDRRDPDTFFACVEQGALLKTTDGGKTWRELSSYYKETDKWYRDIHKFVQFEDSPDSFIMSTGTGVYRSEDNGETWTQLTDLDFDIRYPDHLIVAPGDDSTIFLSGAGLSPDNWRHSKSAGATVQISRDGGKTWALGDQGLGPTNRPAIEAMAVAQHDGGYTLFLANTDGDIYERAHDASEWTPIHRGLHPISKVGHYKHVQPPAEDRAAQ